MTINLTPPLQPDTFSHAYSTFYPILYNSLIKSPTLSHDDAEDIIQEVFSSIWYNRKTWAVRELRPYLFGAVRKQHYKFLYNNRRQAGLIEQYTINTPHRDAPESSDFAVLMEEAVQRLSKELASWSDRSRDIFKLYYHHHMGNAGIARMLGLSEHQVKREMVKLTAIVTGLFVEHPTPAPIPHMWGIRYFANPRNNVPPEIIKRYLKQFPIITWEDFEARYRKGRGVRISPRSHSG